MMLRKTLRKGEDKYFICRAKTMKRTTGEKIQRISNMICIVMAFFCIAAGIVTFSFGVEDGLLITQYVGIAIIPIGVIAFWMLNLILSGFGEIVDNTAKLVKLQKEANESTDKKLEEIKDEVKKVKLAFEYRNSN